MVPRGTTHPCADATIGRYHFDLRAMGLSESAFLAEPIPTTWKTDKSGRFPGVD